MAFHTVLYKVSIIALGEDKIQEWTDLLFAELQSATHDCDYQCHQWGFYNHSTMGYETDNNDDIFIAVF